LSNHYINDCAYETHEWIPHGEVVRCADRAVAIAHDGAFYADQLVKNIFTDVAVSVAHAAANAAEKAAKAVSMCGRLSLQDTKFFTTKQYCTKGKIIYEDALECEAMNSIWSDHNASYRRKECRLEEIYREKEFTFTYRGCGCTEHFTINSWGDAERMYKAYLNRENRAKAHYYLYCEKTALAFQNKDLSNPLYKSYAKKFAPKWPACSYCGATHTTKRNAEFHTFKCKYNPQKLVEIPIFIETETQVNEKLELQYDFTKPAMVYVSKNDIRKLVSSAANEVVAYSMDAEHKPVKRYIIHQVAKGRMPQHLKKDKSYPFKHVYAFTKDTTTLSNTFNWVVT
jgi:hypothetical protein